MSEEAYDSGEASMEAAAPVETDQSDSSLSESRQENHVPVEALQAERAQRQNLQDELRVIKDHLALMQAQQQYGNQQNQQEAGYDKDDVITYGDFERLLSKKERQYQTSIDELRMTQRYPDYNDVVTQYLPEVLKQNPSLRNTLAETQNFELAYYLAKTSDGYKKSNKSKKQNADAERIVRNAQEAGSLSSIGSNSPINKAKKYRDMSDDEFRQEVNRNMGYL